MENLHVWGLSLLSTSPAVVVVRTRPGLLKMFLKNDRNSILPDTFFVPPGSKFQAPHPMSDTRRSYCDDATVDWHKVRALRKLGGAVIPTSKSLTNVGPPRSCDS